MKKVVILAGGGGSSRTCLLAEWIAARLAIDGVDAGIIRIADLDCLELARFAMEGPSVRHLLSSVEGAHGVVVATPIYKASFSGMVKLALDVLPQFGLAGKVVLPVATAGGLAHALALDYALRPVLQSMAARHVVQSTVVSETDWTSEEGGLKMGERAQEMLGLAVDHFAFSLDSRAEVAHLGLPRRS